MDLTINGSTRTALAALFLLPATLAAFGVSGTSPAIDEASIVASYNPNSSLDFVRMSWVVTSTVSTPDGPLVVT